MKKLFLSLAALTGAFTLSACQSTSSSPSPSTSSVATTCTVVNGQEVCSGGTSCAGQAGLTYSNGYWYNSAGQEVQCNTGGLPYGYTGTTGTGTTGVGGNCTYWNEIYAGQAYYVPMIDPTTGNEVCYDIQPAYTAGYVPSTYNMYSQSPIYGSICPYEAEGDPNWEYDCGYGASWNYSGSGYGYGGGSSGVCVGMGDDSGDDYGYGGGFFGICF